MFYNTFILTLFIFATAMNTGTPRHHSPSTQGITQDSSTQPHDDADDPSTVSTFDDDLHDNGFEEFGKYGLMAAQARIKGSSKSSGITKMRQAQDTR